MAEPLRAAVVACGGTGGHVYPAIAIARALKDRHPEATLSFVGRPASFESDAIAREGFAFDPLSIGRLVGQGAAQKLRTLAQIPVAILRAAGALARRKPSVVIGTGGFVSGPTVLAAALRRIPIVVQEQNAVPGFTNRVLCAVASRVALAHQREGVASPKYRVTGNPVRPAFLAVPDWTERKPFALLVLGGSQGARRVNELVISAVRLIDDGSLRVVLQCGPASLEACREQARGLPIDVQPFLHDMPERLAAASLVVSRSGASTIAELCAAGRPSLLVPFPHAAGDHQTANARALADAGAADFVAERDLSPELLAERLRAAVADPARLRRMAAAARSLARPDAAAAVAQLAEEVASA